MMVCPQEVFFGRGDWGDPFGFYLQKDPPGRQGRDFDIDFNSFLSRSLSNRPKTDAGG